MKKLKNVRLSWLTLLLFSVVAIGCGGGGGSDGGSGGGGAAANNAPVLGAIGARTLIEGETLVFTVTATDPDGDPVTLAATGLSPGANFDTTTGAFTWTPTASDAGNVDVSFTASDGSLMDSEIVTITVTASTPAPVNNAPVLGAIGAQIVAEGRPLTFTVTASDQDGDPVTLAATGLSPGASFDTTTGAFAWSTTAGDIGTVDVNFTASDGSLMDSEIVTIRVSALGTAVVEAEAAGVSASNDSATTAETLIAGLAATGDLSLAGDVDLWSFSATAGTVIEIELFGTRLDQQGWGITATVPHLSLIDTDGTTVLLEHDRGFFSWGANDLDIPRFLVPASGNYFLSVTQDNPLLEGGSYALKVSTVDVGTLQLEAEASGTFGANDTAATAEPIQAGTLSGFHVDLGSDFYSFDVVAPSIACFEVTAHRSGIADHVDVDYTDLVLNIFDTDGITLLGNNDDALFFDPALCFGVETAGTYFTEVTNLFGLGDGQYFLDFNLTDSTAATGIGVVEVEPNDSAGIANAIAYGQAGSGTVEAGIGGDEADLFFFSGTAGDVVRIQQFDALNSQGAADSVVIAILSPDGVTGLMVDFDGPAGLQVTRTILQESGNHFVKVMSLGLSGTTSYRFDLELLKAATYETEPNNSIAAANPLDAAGRAAGVIGIVGDEDFFSFSATQDQVVTLSIFAAPAVLGDPSDGLADFSGHGSLLEPVLTIQDALGTTLSVTTFNPAAALVTGESVTNGLATLGVTFVAPSTGTFMVTVAESRAGVGSADHYYVIERE